MLQSMGSRRVGHDLVTEQHTHAHIHTEIHIFLETSRRLWWGSGKTGKTGPGIEIPKHGKKRYLPYLPLSDSMRSPQDMFSSDLCV